MYFIYQICTWYFSLVPTPAPVSAASNERLVGAWEQGKWYPVLEDSVTLSSNGILGIPVQDVHMELFVIRLNNLVRKV